jgi:hypothetical protein
MAGEAARAMAGGFKSGVSGSMGLLQRQLTLKSVPSVFSASRRE